MTTPPTRVRGTIKPLEWAHVDEADIFAKANILSDPQKLYMIRSDLALHGCLEGGFGPHESEDVAKAVAQADYERRILAAIQPDCATEPVAWRCKFTFSEKAILIEDRQTADLCAQDGDWTVVPLYSHPLTPSDDSASVANANGNSSEISVIDAIAACEKIRANAVQYRIPQMAMGAQACIDALRALGGSGNDP